MPRPVDLERRRSEASNPTSLTEGWRAVRNSRRPVGPSVRALAAVRVIRADGQPDGLALSLSELLGEVFLPARSSGRTRPATDVPDDAA